MGDQRPVGIFDSGVGGLTVLKEIDPMVGVYQKACPELVEIVEAGDADSPRAERVVREDLTDIVRLDADHSRLRATEANPRHEVVPQRFDEIAANLFGDAIEAEEVQIWEQQRT